MKKISLITIFDNPNFGTYLQALALSLVLERFDTKVEIVRYMRPVWHNPSLLSRKTKFLQPIRELFHILCGNKGIKQRRQCRKFVSNHISLSSIYYSYEELVKHPPIADVYLTGSDQVWNAIHNHGLDKSFYLAYAPLDKPRYAYAASIGMDNIPDEYRIETKELLSQYKLISVREKSNIRLLNELGIKCSLVLDPTLLLSADEWRKYENQKYKFDEPYVLIYSVESRERGCEVVKIARKVANELGYKLVEVSYFGPDKRIDGCDVYFYYASPDLFLSLVDNAGFIVGSSFHVTAFSINFNKQFLTVTPDRFSSRIDNLLNLTNLTDRKVENIDVYNNRLLEPIDFTYANQILNAERKSSFEFIKQIVL